MENRVDWPNLKKWLLITAGLFVFSMLFVMAAGDTYEGIGILLMVAWFLSLIVTGIKAVFFLVQKGAKKAKEIAQEVIRPKEEKELIAFIEEQLGTGNSGDDLDEAVTRKGDELKIQSDRVTALRSERMHKDLDEKIDAIIRSSRFSDEDEASLSAIGKKHGIELNYNDPSLKKFRLFHLIETSGDFELEPIEANLRMGASEECYFESKAVWRQEKRIRKNTGFIGGSMGVKVAKGVSLRVGKAVPTYKEYDDIVDIDAGTLYVTNKKIVFVGGKKSTNITMGRLANYELYSDAIRIVKTSGSPDIFMLDADDVMLLDVLLQKL